MEKIETDIKYKTFKLLQSEYGKKFAEIKVPNGVVFQLTMGHVISSDEDRDTYNFIAVIPYDENIYNFLLKQKFEYTLHNIFNTYIAWIIKDSTPENFNTFPFTTDEPNIEPFYIKTLNVDKSKKNEMYADLLKEIYNRDGKYPSHEELTVIERKCIEESSTITGYMKITNILFSGVQVVYIRCVPDPTLDSCIDSGIFCQYITYNNLFSYESLPTTENEFNNAVSEILQNFNIL